MIPRIQTVKFLPLVIFVINSFRSDVLSVLSFRRRVRQSTSERVEKVGEVASERHPCSTYIDIEIWCSTVIT